MTNKVYLTLISLALFICSVHAQTYPQNGTSGSFSVLNSEYQDNMCRQYNISVGAGNRVKITGNIDLEGDSYDYINIYETNDSFSELTFIDQWDFGNYTYISKNSNGNLVIIFETDGSVCFDDGYTGFSIQYEVTTEEPTYSNFLSSSTIINGTSTKPNLIVSETGYKNINGTSSNLMNFDNSTLLVKSGGYQLGLGANVIGSSSSLNFKSASTMNFNSSGSYYFNNPTNTYPFKIYSNGKIGINNTSSNWALINGKLNGTTYEGFLDFRSTETGKCFKVLNGGGNSFMPTVCGETTDALSALYFLADIIGETSGPRGYMTFDSRYKSATASSDQVLFEFCSGYGNRLVHIMGDGTIHTKAGIEAKGLINANEIMVKDMSASNLNLNGTLAANKITVKANGNTADFVFSDDYTLKSLTEVENYIKTHKHLPDIPSAEAMEKQGVNLAEMNKLLLQKVEELTLYTIEKDKEVQELKEARSKEEGERIKETEDRKKETEELKERLAKIEALLMK